MRNMGESNKKSIMNKYGQVFWPQQITLLQERRQQMLWVFRPRIKLRSLDTGLFLKALGSLSLLLPTILTITG